MNPDKNIEFIEFDPVNWLRQSRDVLWKRRNQVFGFIAIAMTLIVVGLIVCPRAYLSDAKLFVRVGRESVALDPTATTGKTLQLHQTRESEITSVMDLLKTRGLYAEVVDRIGEKIILGEQVFNEQAWLEKRGTISATKKPANDQLLPGTTKQREKAVKELLTSINREREEKSSVLTLACTASTPELARAILTEYIAIFQTHHFEANRTSGSYMFFEQQTSEIRQQYIEASQKLREIRKSLGSVSVNTRRESIQKQTDLLEQERLTSTISLQASEAMIRSLKQAIIELPEQRIAESVTGLPDDAIGTIRKEISLLTVREAELLSRYTENYPAVIAVRRRREEAARVLRTTSEEPSQVKKAVNPSWQEMNVKLLLEKSNASSLSARIDAINDSLQGIQKQLLALNLQEAGMVNVEQTIKLLQEKLGNYSERIEESRIEEAMAKSGISNINIVQPPSLILKAASPRMGIILIVGFLFASFSAVSLVLLKNMFDTTPQFVESNSRSTSNANSSSQQSIEPQDSLQTITAISDMVEEAGY